ncbi:hypothetical protein [Desulfosarcina cetonica]|uniref:hypothetical protein n=1 Tax=Desulfosarcina cetonica TaxID=90730 RepID=UPI0012EDE9A2|nr:hypothetical protein [Desulfosarcina cetonica]
MNGISTLPVSIDDATEICRLQLDSQVNGESKSGVWGVDADTCRSMEIGPGIRFFDQLESLDYRSIQGRTVQFIDHDVGPLQRKGVASTPAPADRDYVLRVMYDHIVLATAAALNRAGM